MNEIRSSQHAACIEEEIVMDGYCEQLMASV